MLQSQFNINMLHTYVINLLSKMYAGSSLDSSIYTSAICTINRLALK